MADADQLLSAPAGVAHNAGTGNTIAATVEAATAAGMAHVQYIEQDISPQGAAVGESLPLPPAPDHDTSILGGQPPMPVAYVPPAPPQQGGTQ